MIGIRRAAALLLLALLALSFVATPFARAQDEEEDQATVEETINEAAEAAEEAYDEPRGYAAHPLTNLAPESPDVFTKVIFVNQESDRFPIGKINRAIVGFRNTGVQSINVTGIMGSLNAAHDFGLYIQNFTGRGIGRVVTPHGEASFEYPFFPAPELEPMDVQVALTIFYSDDEGHYSTTFFNKTVELLDVSPAFDLKSSFQYILFFAVVAVVAFALFKASGSGKSKKRSAPAPRPVERGTSDSGAGGEFAEEYRQRSAALSSGRNSTPRRRR